MGRIVYQRAYKCLGNMNRGYTLVELCITLAVILLLSTIGLYAYFGLLTRARDTVCETNIRGIKRAVEEFVFENDALPATLGDLEFKHVEKGYAKVIKEMDWRTKFAINFLKLDASNHAHAQFLSRENLRKYGAKEKIFHCSADDDGLPSYGIREDLKDRNWSDVGPDEIIIADCDQYVFTSLDQLAKRHRHKAFAITKAGKIIKISDSDHADDDTDIVTGETDSDDDDADADDDKVTICHNGTTTLSISKSALAAHLGHGDTMGPCP
jgi:prepilin-type N-terminal cleavage/methylation domain-containing protein